ncbi:argininosuccinate lyase [Candidatus Gottesmanbacteria bacterium RIFCSPLOWO2_01_FULL_43_11b]|uniref:Argininosuccinate lyase n=1 Tax=Candidatus Gottesmanbacteria bacterium RIFCSPLOWO2_01_FULL_43_11b TaxID=1798392 RepID=A0A1F6AGM5_9BACT|nr:MAG: argininosuccinate lyase [Candidatus Gottesmanbacteria bacterium RIFCSPLOWO2_01_FULL_43_11b]
MAKPMKKQINKLWGTAFNQQPSEAVLAFTAGRDVVSVPPADAVLLPYDVWVDKAHCVMLAKTGIIPVADAGKILAGLLELEKLVIKGKFHLEPSKEDVHTNIESWLTKKLGIEVAGKLHTARSRNDQIVTDMKLYLKDQMLMYVSNGTGLAQTLIKLAEIYKAVSFPGFTHHQHAMVTTFGHVLAGFATMIIRDIERFEGWYKLHNQSPLGNSVAYGTSFPINKKLTAELLGFDGPDLNSMDAITNRWEPEADFAFAITILMNHLSLIAETLILLATSEFDMIKLADAFSTGSSIMPQKKNPDPLEVIKGKTAFAQGQLVSLLAIGKANFIGYNRDSQWTKYIIMDLINECKLAPVVLAGVLETMTVNADVMEKWCHKGFIAATTVMEQIIQNSHMPMREAKVKVEQLVKTGSDKLDLDPKKVISLTKSFGGPGKNSMKTALKKLKKKLSSHKTWLLQKQKEKEHAQELLWKHIQTISK